ncbi:MAG TPA: BlaI/MecI/CopY family transcriptional regulator [Polyangiaceae bacterium]|jgi:predicted transcriptional regulator|nr:BlaI/MecI/CopY family transcriptional regulator [Polyangiaceae bacterium]
MVATPDLGPLEMQVLGLLDRDEPLTVADVRSRLAAAGEDLAYTTVMTVLVRLCEKKVVQRRKDGNRFRYVASKRSGRVSEGILERVKRSLFQSDRTRPLLALLADEHLSDDELRALRSVIDERLSREKAEKERGS